ncbi:copper homeostasis protein CutC [Paenibacillus sp. HJGM_3]|uniref:copper homeostasis protein CutC n=1 Tax=Paenibacillus sp. HJGM_3 TaxID=3379816 RepID=UPI00385BBD67
MILEIIATSVEDAVAAEQAGAGRIELICALQEGGLTPSYGLIERTLASVSIPVRVMIRPHSRDFVYTVDELETMLADIRMAKRLGASGLVFGALNADGRVSVPAVQRLCEAAAGLPVTFHRAFDDTPDLYETLQVLETIPVIDRVLTSGGHPESAWNARTTLCELQAGTPLRLIAGKGLQPDNLDSFLAETQLTEVHLGTGVRFGHRASGGIDKEKVRQAADIIHQTEQKRKARSN